MRRSVVCFIIGAVTFLATTGCGQTERKSVIEPIPMENGKPVYSESAATAIEPVNYIDSSLYSVSDGDYYAIIYPGHSSELSINLDLYYCDQFDKNDICKIKYGDTISMSGESIQVENSYLQSDNSIENQDGQYSLTGITGAVINGGAQNGGVTLKYIAMDGTEGHFCPVDVDGNPITHLIGQREIGADRFISYTEDEPNGSKKSIVGIDEILKHMVSNTDKQWKDTYLHVKVKNMQITKIVNDNIDALNND